MTIKRLLRPLFWAALLFSFVMAVLPHPPRLPGAPSDKVQHVIAFATLATLGGLGFPKLRRIRLLIWLSLYGALIEAVQAIPMLHRDSDYRDWIADTAAAGAVLLVLHFWARRRAAAA